MVWVTATALLQKTLEQEAETLDLAHEVHTCKIPSTTKSRKPDYPRPGIDFLILVGSGAKEDKKLPESGLLVFVGSGAKEDKKLPESGFLGFCGFRSKGG